MRQVLPDIYLIEGLRVAHGYVLASEEGLTPIDGATPGEVDEIAAQIEEEGYTLSDVGAIVPRTKMSTNCSTAACGGICAAGVPFNSPWLMAKARSMPKNA